MRICVYTYNIYAYNRVYTRSFSDYATKNLADDYNVICGRRRQDATHRHAPSSGFPHVNNSWNNRCRYSIIRQDGDVDDVARKCREHERNRFADSWFAETSPPRVAARPRRGVCTRRGREIHHVIRRRLGKYVKRASQSNNIALYVTLIFIEIRCD